MKIALYGKKIEPKDVSKIQELFTLLQKERIQYIVHRQLEESVKKHSLITFESVDYYNSYDDLKTSGVSFLLSIGGDGTFLDTIILVRDLKIPILGINTGRLGFLSNTPTSEIKSAVNDIITGSYSTQERSLLRLDSSENHFGNDNHALNEISILKSDSSSMITIHT